MKGGKDFKGSGARHNPDNPYLKQQFVREESDEETSPHVEFIRESPKNIVNRVTSPDLPMEYSMNPYQGCEHGCAYCYARPTHEFWGFSAGLDFERKIIIKEKAPELLKQFFRKKNYRPGIIALSGNTDCYQPAEAKFQITRRILEVFLHYRNPVGIITKNSLILRDMDILKKLNELRLLRVSISVTSLNEDLRRQMEPRTASAEKRIRTIETLSNEGIPVHVMVAPVIPGLNDHEIPSILEKTSTAGALGASFTIVRLNGNVGEVFSSWIRQEFPDRAEKVLSQVAACHGGNLNDSVFGRRMRGEGNFADAISKIFSLAHRKYFPPAKFNPLDLTIFRVPGGQTSLF